MRFLIITVRTTTRPRFKNEINLLRRRKKKKKETNNAAFDETDI